MYASYRVNRSRHALGPNTSFVTRFKRANASAMAGLSFVYATKHSSSFHWPNPDATTNALTLRCIVTADTRFRSNYACCAPDMQGHVAIAYACDFRAILATWSSLGIGICTAPVILRLCAFSVATDSHAYCKFWSLCHGRCCQHPEAIVLRDCP